MVSELTMAKEIFPQHGFRRNRTGNYHPECVGCVMKHFELKRLFRVIGALCLEEWIPPVHVGANTLGKICPHLS